MPIIIDEIVISVDVSNQASGGAVSLPPEKEDTQNIVNECVEKVLDIITRQKER